MLRLVSGTAQFAAFAGRTVALRMASSDAAKTATGARSSTTGPGRSPRQPSSPGSQEKAVPSKDAAASPSANSKVVLPLLALKGLPVVQAAEEPPLVYAGLDKPNQEETAFPYQQVSSACSFRVHKRIVC